MAIYIYSDRRENAAELVTFVKSIGGEAILLSTAEQAPVMRLLGADQVISVAGTDSLEYVSLALSQYLHNAAPQLILMSNTMRGRALAARVSALLDVAMVGDVSTVEAVQSGFEVEHMLYGGRAVSREHLPLGSVVTMGKGRYAQSEGASPVMEFDLAADPGIRVRERRPIVKEEVDLSCAKRILSVGMGLRKPEDLEMIREVCTAMDGEMACSRGVSEERKWLPLSRFVGISGNVISPDLYLAAGISGQIQHIFGVKEAKIIVGINLNEKAPIFRAADYGIVGDLYELLPIFKAKLEQRTEK